MKKLVIHISCKLLFVLGVLTLQAQERIPIARMVGETVEITTDTTKLAKALKRTLADGTIITNVYVISEKGVSYLVGTGTKSGYQKLVAAQLGYDMATRIYYASPENAHVVCASAACNECIPLKENGLIIACLCRDNHTASNHCSFSRGPKGSFYQSLSHFLRLSK
jgi:hypothetical protein